MILRHGTTLRVYRRKAMLDVPQIKLKACAPSSCSTKRPDRDGDLMKMRR
jgi:hypothetical protein